MKKYIKPELEITAVKAQAMLNSISMTTDPADPDYTGGGDAKRIDFASDDNDFSF